MTENKDIATPEQFANWFDSARFGSVDPRQELIDALEERDAALIKKSHKAGFAKGAEWMRSKTLKIVGNQFESSESYNIKNTLSYILDHIDAILLIDDEEK